MSWSTVLFIWSSGAATVFLFNSSSKFTKSEELAMIIFWPFALVFAVARSLPTLFEKLDRDDE